MAILTIGLQNLRRQVNAAFPERDKTSDGWIGDPAHQRKTSGHNPDDKTGSKPAWNGDPDDVQEVRSWDCDNDFGPGVDAQDVVDHMRALRGLSSVIRYMIYNRKMYHVDNGYRPEPYDGSSPHTEHIHFEGAWTQAADNNKTFNFRLEEIPVAMTADDKKWIAGEIARQLAGVDEIVWGHKVTVDGYDREAGPDLALIEKRAQKRQTEVLAQIAKLKPATPPAA